MAPLKDMMETSGNARACFGFGLTLLAAGLAGLSACGKSRNNGTAAAGGKGGSGGSGGAPAATCPGAAPASLGFSARLDVPLSFALNGLPMGAELAGPSRTGAEYQVTVLKFFLAEPTLIDANNQEIPSQLVTADGAPLPFGLQLIDKDDPASHVLHLATSPGTYTALRFGVGVPDSCNWIENTAQAYPLSPDSDMFWYWGAQFLFFRAEGSSRPQPTEPWRAFEYHVGYDPAFVSITVPGSIEVGSSAVPPTLELDIDRALEPQGQDATAQHPVPFGWVIDNLEINQAFTLK